MRFEIQDGCYRYREGDREVLRHIELSVGSGDVLAILGPNGAGKTTLLRCALGLLPWKSGQTLLDGQNIKQMNYRKLWQRIAYVPQAKQAISPYTVEEMVLLGRSSHFGSFRLPGEKDQKKAEEAIERLGLEHLRKKNCSEISGGELQMVLIARALATEPEMLVLDEPESNLDFKNQLLVLDTISALAQEGLACVFNTHYPAHALRRANQALMLGRDGTFECGRTGDVVTEASIARYFGVYAAIGKVETAGNVYEDVVPISMNAGGYVPMQQQTGRIIASLSIIVPDRAKSKVVNQTLHAASALVIGRMGMPHPDGELHFINLMLDGPAAEIRQLGNALNAIDGISAKVTYAKEMAQSDQSRSNQQGSSESCTVL